jgi:phage replication-related protein YjqB (UPF0714/DUF867 family)
MHSFGSIAAIKELVNPLWYGESWGLDFSADFCTLAIHGGGIERGTSEIQRRITELAGGGFYRFEGYMNTNNSRLHVPSTMINGRVRILVPLYDRCLSIHGCSGPTPMTHVGGQDITHRDAVISALSTAGFAADVATGNLAGTNYANICNDTGLAAGVQLEISAAQRDAFFTVNTLAGRWTSCTAAFEDYCTAVASTVS